MSDQLTQRDVMSWQRDRRPVENSGIDLDPPFHFVPSYATCNMQHATAILTLVSVANRNSIQIPNSGHDPDPLHDNPALPIRPPILFHNA